MMGSGLLKVPSMPKLENVLLVNGLKVNLINTSQLYDHNLFFKFTKDKCSVADSTNACVMEGKRSSNNFYFLTCSRTCCTTLLNNLDIWNRRIGHNSHKNCKTWVNLNFFEKRQNGKLSL